MNLLTVTDLAKNTGWLKMTAVYMAIILDSEFCEVVWIKFLISRIASFFGHILVS